MVIFLAVKRVCGNSLDFWAEVIEIENSIDEALNGYMAKLDNTKQTNRFHPSYQDIENTLSELIYQNATQKNLNLIKSLVWDIVWYFGVASAMSGYMNSLINSKSTN